MTAAILGFSIVFGYISYKLYSDMREQHKEYLEFEKERKNVFKEGFWREKENEKEDKLPFPKDNTEKSKELIEFIEKFKLVQRNSYYTGYLGYSTCRLCGIENGSDDRFFRANDGKRVIWPEGLIHYYEIHNVIPSPKFKEYIEEQYKKEICGNKLLNEEKNVNLRRKI